MEEYLARLLRYFVRISISAIKLRFNGYTTPKLSCPHHFCLIRKIRTL